MELKLKLWDSKTARLDFIAWKVGGEAFYAKPRNGKPRVVTLVPSLPEDALWINPPFPNCAPINIEPCLLLPPPIYASEEDLARSIAPEPWVWSWWNTHGFKFLHLDESDNKPLAELLDEYKAAAYSEYQAEKLLLGIGRLSHAKRRKWRQQRQRLKRHYEGALHEVAGIECAAGVLNMSLGMVKRGHEGIRDRYLLQWWATEKKIDLEAMARQRGEFMRYLQTYAGNAAIISDFKGGLAEKYRGVRPLRFGGEDAPEFKALCASIKYRVEFENGKAAFIFDLEERKELRADEWIELKEHHDIETPHKKRATEGKRKGGSVKKYDDPLTEKEVVKEFARRLGKSQKKTTAAKGTAVWAEDQFGQKIHFKTVLNYAISAGVLGK